MIKSETEAQIVRQNRHQITLQVLRRPCVGCDGRCGMIFQGSTDNSVVIDRPYVQTGTGPFAVGEQVEVLVAVPTLIGLSSLVYLAPVVLMLLSAVVCGWLYSQADSAVAISAGIGLLAGFGLVKFLLTIYENKQAAETLLLRRGSM